MGNIVPIERRERGRAQFVDAVLIDEVELELVQSLKHKRLECLHEVVEAIRSELLGLVLKVLQVPLSKVIRSHNAQGMEHLRKAQRHQLDSVGIANQGVDGYLAGLTTENPE